MDKLARRSEQQRAELFQETAASRGMTPAIVEKDFWVSWILGHLYQNKHLARELMFKGGTSLSKVYGLIERFSEDIDLILDWRAVTADDPMATRSKTKQSTLNQQINDKAQAYIASDLLSLMIEAVGDLCDCDIDKQDPYVMNIRYPAAFKDDYLRPQVRLEIGPLASWLPFEEKTISCYAAEAFPNVFDTREYAVRVITAERTFWEKATILHHEAHRPKDNPQPSRYSRHYYDLAKMANSSVKQKALNDLALLENVVAFKQRFYPRGWAKYELAVPGSLKLVPPTQVLNSVQQDYKHMQDMIFGDIPDFEVMMHTLQTLENDINQK
ncbi:MAG: nucleotidyl transferase AbiEii/AbiGii toxin family protein [Thiohalomonadales bacterium]